MKSKCYKVLEIITSVVALRASTSNRMHIQNSETRKNFPLSRKIIFKKTIQATILLIALLVVVYLSGIFTLDFDVHLTSLIVGSLALLVFIVAYIYESSYFASYFYDLTDTYLIVKKDPIMPREITVPYERIVSVTIDRDVFDYILGICDLHVNTANTAYMGMEAHIDGLTRDAANGLQGVIISKMNEAKAVAKSVSKGSKNKSEAHKTL